VRDIDLKQLSALPTAAGLIARDAYARARKAKIELAPLLKEAGLTGQQIEDQDSRITVRAQIKFLNVVANALQDPLLGFHIAQTADLRKLGLLYYVGASSETLGEVLQRAARYSSTANEGLSLKYRVDPDISIELGYVGVARHLDRQQMECFMTMLLRLCRQLSGVRLVPSRLRLVHRSDNERSEFAAYFGGNVDFSAGVDELTFPQKTRDMVVVSADRYLKQAAGGELRGSSVPATGVPGLVPISCRERDCPAVASWKGARLGNLKETRLDPANMRASAFIGGSDVFAGPRHLEGRPGEAIPSGPGFINLPDCVASRVPGGQRIHARVQASDGQDTEGSTLAAAIHPARVGIALRQSLKVPPVRSIGQASGRERPAHSPPSGSRRRRLRRRTDDTAPARRRISGVSEHGQRRFNAIIRDEQLHTGASTFHAEAHTNDDGRYAGSVQCDPS
jgi:Arabinose-binding domain of AraC transcription regulator, N-term